MSSTLTKELRKKYEKRNFPIHKGDNVRIMRGQFKGKTGKIDVVDMTKYRVSVDGIFRSKKDGTKVNVWFAPSNLQIKDLVLEDKKRKAALERKAVVKEKADDKKEDKTKFKPLPKEDGK